MEPTAAPSAPQAGTCLNCGAVLHGPYCYRCGQPVKGLVRHFSSILGDFFDSVFDLDGRIWRTLPPLLLRPGHLSNEYFADRRVRYVSPVRLFVFMSLVSFFAAQLTLNIEGDGAAGDSEIARAESVEEVRRLREEALAALERSGEHSGDAPGVGAAMQAARRAVERQAERRLAELRGEVPPDPPKPTLSFGSEPWDAKTNPVAIDWLPEAANAWLNRQIRRAEGNIARVQAEPNLLKDAVLGALPATLFVLLPLFALLLKLAYLLKRRLYMEHLIVALHSHAFLCLALLLSIVLDALSESVSWLRWLGAVETALFVWMPLYLLLMQKRVYRQGWVMTLLKFFVIGVVYFSLLTTGVVFTTLGSLIWL